MRYLILAIFIAAFVVGGATCSRCDQNIESKQQAMVERQIRFRGISDEKVLKVMREVPRVAFVTEEHHKMAYDDLRVPTGHGQTLDRPYEDALILNTIKIKPTDVVLEVGTGSGYLAALMSRLADKVYTIEIVPELGNQASERLAKLMYSNVEVKVGDGFLGWEEKAPFDVIVLTASPATIPTPLKDQLKDGGRMLLPYGGDERFQELLLYTKKDGQLNLARRVAPTQFVPMKGKAQENQ